MLQIMFECCLVIRNEQVYTFQINRVIESGLTNLEKKHADKGRN